MKAAYRWLNKVTFNSYVHTVRWAALGIARVVIGTVPFYFFVVIQRLYLASAAAEAMAAIHKDLGSRLAEITGSVEELRLPNQVVTT